MSLQRPVILVIEDDPDVSEGMVSLLEEEGYEAVSAMDGAEGLQKLRSQTNTQLVLLDLTMPRMSAAEFRQHQLRDSDVAHVPVLLMSAGLDVARQAKALGAVAFVNKPFKPDALLATIARAIATHPTASA